jgi:hypothetical protein
VGGSAQAFLKLLAHGRRCLAFGPNLDQILA